jgi:hypothetical protein
MVASDSSYEPVAAQLAEHPVDDSEPVSEALVDAFDSAGVRDLEEASVLYDWIEPDAIDLLFRHTNGDPEVVVELWGHPVHITRDAVTIYESEQA